MASDELISFYGREIDALRGLAKEFAETHPKIATRLRLAGDKVDDPHVERLLQGVAFLTARTQQRLDDEFPEITDALLGVLYPHYLAPVPSGAIVQFACKPELRVPIEVPRGTMLETEAVDDEAVHFQTASSTMLWPIEVETVRMTGLPLAAPVNPKAQGARSSLRVVLRLSDPEATFAELETPELRFFLRGPLEQMLALYELLCGHLVGICAADGPNDDKPTAIPPVRVQPAGFAEDEALYPWSARSFSGFRLLTEYFALPEKFLFVDVTNLDARTLVHESNRLELFFYFDRDAPSLERQLKPDCLALGCAPIVNLFPRQCEPITIDHTMTEYEIVPDYRSPRALEVWSVERVGEIREDGTMKAWRPFYGSDAINPDVHASGFFNLVRRDGPGAIGGSSVLLAPFDPTQPADAPVEKVLSVNALCTNRDLAHLLPFGGGQPKLFASDGLSSVAAITCLTAPTPTLRAPLREQHSNRLISHLSLSHLSVVGGPAAAETLRNVLRLYDLLESAENKAAIAGLVNVHAHEGTARVPGARLGAFCRGLDVTLEFDQGAWESNGLYLLASVLERFLALHATVNSFVRTRAILRGRPGAVATFPPRAGAQVLL